MVSLFKSPPKPNTKAAEESLALQKDENEKLEKSNRARISNQRSRSGGYARDTAFKGQLSSNTASVSGLSSNLGVK